MVFVTTKKVYFETMRERGVLGLIVKGSTGAGKSAYAIKVLAQLHGKLKVEENEQGNKELILEEANWDAWKKWLVFMPEDFLKKLQEAYAFERQLPALVWDDAGAWANKYMWYTPVAQKIAAWLNTARTAYACMIWTTPDEDDLFAAIRNFPDNHLAPVRKYTQDEWRREVIVYDKWKSPDGKKKGVAQMYVDRYNCKLPDAVHEEYRGIRREYNKILLDEIERSIKEHELRSAELEGRAIKLLKVRGYVGGTTV
ncbi:MAG: hypothetical protein ABC596_08860 [Candidatus Methanosuratincola petrocarbonis]